MLGEWKPNTKVRAYDEEIVYWKPEDQMKKKNIKTYINGYSKDSIEIWRFEKTKMNMKSNWSTHWCWRKNWCSQ